MPNSSGMSTGHELGDTGIFSNTIYTGYPVAPAAESVTPFIENDAVLGDIDAHFAGNVVDEDSIVKAARGKNFSTAIIGKVGPTLMSTTPSATANIPLWSTTRLAALAAFRSRRP